MTAEKTMTVVEFATQHCSDCGSGEELRGNIQQHVNMLAEASMSMGFALWKVGIDGDGRVSLIWSSMPVELWETMLAEAIKLSLIKQKLGLS